MIRALRNSFAAKLLVAGLILVVVIVGGISSYLLVSRDRQTRSGALSNSDNRAAVIRQALDRFTGVQALSAASGLASQHALQQALGLADPGGAVRSLFGATPSVIPSGSTVVVADGAGRVLFAQAAVDVPAGGQITQTSPPSLAAARIGVPRCDLPMTGGQPPAGVCGVELLGGQQPSYDVAVPVSTGGRLVGVVAFLSPLGAQLERFRSLVGFPTAFISAGRPDLEVRIGAGTSAPVVSPDELRSGIRDGGDLVHATYPAPTSSGRTEDVAGSFAALRGIDHDTIVGYLGVEAPLSVFAGDTRTDELTVLAIGLFILAFTAIAVTVFVTRFVRRPVGILSSGVARIAGGDYSTAVDLRSRDELGRLAQDVNRMRDSIASYLGEIRQSRVRLDSAVARISSVSRTLTMTTSGIEPLEREVVRTARAIAGGPATAHLAGVDGGRLVARVADPPDAAPPEIWPAELLGGRAARASSARGALAAVPMFYQDRVVGALAVQTPDADGIGGDEETVLGVLANNAAVALENTRLFEQERETVRRLRELDRMKNDFLSTVQHELRTPLTAILGLADLMEMAWGSWEDPAKLDAVRDIQVAARNLHEMVETLINFAMLENDALRLEPVPVAVRPAIDSARAALGERTKGELPVRVTVEGAEDERILADPVRFEDVMRALLDNAVKFSHEGGEVRVVIGHDARGEVLIDVIDQGIGMPPEQLPRIFDRFYQIDGSATRRSGGTGMGLALVQRLVEAHNGRVEVESAEGRGSHFTLHWPAAPR